MLLFAHTGPCRPSEVASTLGIASILGIALFRPWRRTSVRDRLSAFAVPLLLAAVVTGGACASKSTPSSKRPTSTARIAIVSPTANEVTGPNVAMQVRVDGGTVVQRTTGKLTPTEGHIHVLLDGKLIVMAYGTTQELKDLAPGAHNLQAEFVAVDHAPFTNRPIAAVLFTVGSP